MLKIANFDIVTGEVPTEISLAINISNCPYKCPGCHSDYLWKDVGEELNEVKLTDLIESNKGITCVCFMGGDQDISTLLSLLKFVKNKGLKTCLYTGGNKNFIGFDEVIHYLDYIKLGQFIKSKGGLEIKGTNQRFFKVNQLDNHDFELIDWTYKFQR